ncbi:MAG TPA: hypothetical protein VMF31_05020 [Solirubrobacterales bacterium]|nr:hypothetical protein [Solirubrobacterales bacterium]
MFLLGALAIVWLSTAALGHFVLGAWPSFGEALWQSTAHLLEPGSLADDHDGAERAIGLIQVLAGLVFFAGIVLTVLTEMVQRAISRFHGSDPAISRSGHILVVGFNPTLKETRERLSRYMAAEPPEMVVLLPESMSDAREEARRILGETPGHGTVLAADLADDGFARACAGDAQRIVILSPVGDPDEADVTVMGWTSLLAEHLAPLGDAAPPVGLEIRRHRNVNAFWFERRSHGGDPQPAGGRRFPANFDPLVRDRIIGGTLSQAILNPEFADSFLDTVESLGLSPRLRAAGEHAGRPFAEARSALEPTTLLGLLSGDGPAAEAEYLPADERVIRGDERLIVIPHSPGHSPAGLSPIDPSTIKVSPTRPGPVLFVGFSDATRSVIEDLADSGYDGSRVHLLNPEPPAAFPAQVRGSKPVFIAGSPIEPEDLEHAIDQVDPAIIFVAAPDGHEASAVISGMMVSQRSEVPVIVEQSASVRARTVRGAEDSLTVVSTAGIVAEIIATSTVDPAMLVATQTLFDDPGLEVESLTYASRQPLPIESLPAAFASAGSVPIAISLRGDSGGSDHLEQGDHILVLQRVSAD